MDDDTFLFELKLYDEAVGLSCADGKADHDAIWNGIQDRLNKEFLHAIRNQRPALPEILRVAPAPVTVQQHVDNNSGGHSAGDSCNDEIDKDNDNQSKNHSRLSIPTEL